MDGLKVIVCGEFDVYKVIKSVLLGVGVTTSEYTTPAQMLLAEIVITSASSVNKI